MSEAATDPPERSLDGQSRTLIASGIFLFLISLLNGFAIQALPLKHLALSAHLVGLIGSIFLIGLGAVWAKLRLRPPSSRVGTVLAVYGFCGGWLLDFTAAATRTGGMFPIASGNTRGTDLAERIVSVGMLTIALALFSLAAVVLHGLILARGNVQKQL